MALISRGILWLALLLAWTVVSQAQKHREVEDMFLDFQKRETPLYFCNANTDGVKYRLPKRLQCNNPVERVNSSIVLVTLFWNDLSIKPIAAKECFYESYQVRRTPDFFSSITSTLPTTKLHIAESDCRDMIKSQVSPTGERLERIREGLFGTNNHNTPEYPYFSSNYATNYNYYFSVTTLINNPSDNSVTGVVPLLDNCPSSLGVCPSLKGIVVWNAKEISACRVKQGETTGCLKTGNRISCPDINLSFTDLDRRQICNISVAFTGQGNSVYLTSEVAGELVDGTVSTTEAKRSFFGSHGRFKRHVGTTIYSTDEINAKFQYLHEVVRKKFNYFVVNLHQNVCRSQQMTLDLAYYMAESGSPTALARTLTGDKSFRARLNGDVISLWKCEEIKDYYFLNRDNCTIEWPLRFIKGHDQYHGWLVPMSHEIILEPTLVNCPVGNFYFETNNGVVLLTNKTTMSEMPHLPIPGDSDHPNLMADITFSGTGVYSLDEWTGRDSFMSMMRKIGHQMVIDAALESTKKGFDLNPQQQEAVDLLGFLVLPKLIEKVNWIITVVSTISAVIGLCLFVHFFDPIRKAFVTVFGCMVGCFRYLKGFAVNNSEGSLRNVIVDKSKGNCHNAIPKPSAPSHLLMESKQGNGPNGAPELPPRPQSGFWENAYGTAKTVEANSNSSDLQKRYPCQVLDKMKIYDSI